MILYQKNIFQEFEYDRFVAALKKNFKTQQLNVIPFTNDFDGELEEMPTHCFGSTRFIDVCRAKGLPVYDSFGPIEEYAPEYWLNWDGWDCKLGAIDFKEHDEVFVKPYTEKLFTGCVVKKGEPFPAQVAFSEGKDENEELVRVSPSRRMHNEWRFFVKDGKVITGSLYKHNGKRKTLNLDKFSSPRATIENMISRHGPLCEAYVVDIGNWIMQDQSVSRPRIVEFNNFNSSGFYDCDVEKIVNSLK